MSDPDCGLEAIKTGLDDVKKSVGDGKKKVAAAIAAKGVTTAADSVFDTLAANIGKIVTLSSGSADANATAAQILSGYSAYVKGAKVNGSMPSLGAQTITPGTAAKTIAAGRYLSGLQTIAGDANLVAANIKKGVSIFGITGNYEGLGGAVSGDLTTYNDGKGTFFAKPQEIPLPFTPSIVILCIYGSSNNYPEYGNQYKFYVKLPRTYIGAKNGNWDTGYLGSLLVYQNGIKLSDNFKCENISSDYDIRKAFYIAVP